MTYLCLAGLAITLHVGFVVFVLFGGLALYRWAWVAWLHVPAVGYAILIQTHRGQVPTAHTLACQCFADLDEMFDRMLRIHLYGTFY